MFKASNKLRSNNGVKRVTVRAKPGSKTKCLVRIGNLTVQGSLGRAGRTIFKREGDGATPIAAMKVLHGYHRPNLAIAVRSQISMQKTHTTSGWCDDPNHASYNRPVTLPFPKSHETLQRSDELYDFIIVLDWNIRCRKRYCGSAIFFHVAKAGYKPTEGCIAISKRDMQRILPLLGTNTIVVVR